MIFEMFDEMFLLPDVFPQKEMTCQPLKPIRDFLNTLWVTGNAITEHNPVRIDMIGLICQFTSNSQHAWHEKFAGTLMCIPSPWFLAFHFDKNGFARIFILNLKINLNAMFSFYRVAY